jgi:hypothetical protein
MAPKKVVHLRELFFFKLCVCVKLLSGTAAPSTTSSSKMMFLSVTAQEMKQEGTEQKFRR